LKPGIGFAVNISMKYAWLFTSRICAQRLRDVTVRAAISLS
jgi:hypothetical protein